MSIVHGRWPLFAYFCGNNGSMGLISLKTVPLPFEDLLALLMLSLSFHDKPELASDILWGPVLPWHTHPLRLKYLFDTLGFNLVFFNKLNVP